MQTLIPIMSEHPRNIRNCDALRAKYVLYLLSCHICLYITMLVLFKRKSQSMPNIFLYRKQRNMLFIRTKVFIFALAIREDIDASIKSVGCKYIKIVPNK
jgi:hypothetical protein